VTQLFHWPFFSRQRVDRTLKTLTGCINTCWVYVLAAHWPACSFELAFLVFSLQREAPDQLWWIFQGSELFLSGCLAQIGEARDGKWTLCYILYCKIRVCYQTREAHFKLRLTARGGEVLNVEILNVGKSFEHSTWLRRFANNFSNTKRKHHKNERKCQARFEKPPQKRCGKKNYRHGEIKQQQRGTH
jgi:hypothetical protein